MLLHCFILVLIQVVIISQVLYFYVLFVLIFHEKLIINWLLLHLLHFLLVMINVVNVP